jgi:Flp pilus assembly protein TadG
MRFDSSLKGVIGTAASFVKADRGNVAMMFALAALPILGAVGAAIDYTREVNARSAMQAAIDATALMLAQDAPTLTAAQLASKAQSYFNQLYHHPEVGSVVLTAAYTANAASGGSTVVLTGSGTMPTDFMQVAGYPTMSLSVNSTATWGNTKLRVALALDNTGSMADAGKMTALKGAAKTLIDQLSASASNQGDVYISIVPFTTDVNIGTSYASATWLDWSNWSPNGSIENGMTCSSGSGHGNGNGGGGGRGGGGWGSQTCGSSANNTSQWNGCVMDRTQNYDTTATAPTASDPNTYFPADQSAWCPVQMMPLSYDWTALKTKIDSMIPNGYTGQPIGLAWAWMSLLQTAPLSAPAEDSSYKYAHAIIILSDGLNNTDRWYFNDQTDVDARQKILCDNIKAAGVTIYSIQVNTDGEAQSSVLAYCATDSSDFFYLTSSSQVLSTFNTIGTKLSKLRISK